MSLEYKKIVAYTSSITGNTRKVMDYIVSHLGEKVERYDTPNFLKEDILPQGDIHIIGFWCRRGSMDDASLALLDQMKDQNIILVGTLGNYPEAPYGKRVMDRVSKLVEEKNHLQGVFLCRGKIEESRTEKRRSLPPNHRHYLDDEGYKRHLDSRSHPDEKDLRDAATYVKSVVEAISVC